MIQPYANVTQTPDILTIQALPGPYLHRIRELRLWFLPALLGTGFTSLLDWGEKTGMHSPFSVSWRDFFPLLLWGGFSVVRIVSALYRVASLETVMLDAGRDQLIRNGSVLGSLETVSKAILWTRLSEEGYQFRLVLILVSGQEIRLGESLGIGPLSGRRTAGQIIVWDNAYRVLLREKCNVEFEYDGQAKYVHELDLPLIALAETINQFLIAAYQRKRADETLRRDLMARAD